MILYLSIMIFGILLISGLNILLCVYNFNYSGLWVISATTLGVIIEFCIVGIAAGVVHSMSNSKFTLDKKFFNVSKEERKFYDKLNIKSWKDKVWELGALGGFRKNKINDPNNPKYIELFIIESNKGIIGHIAGMVVGFLIMLFPLPKYFLRIGLPIALINLFLHLLPIMVLRYNIPRLSIAYQRALKTYKIENNEQSEKKDLLQN